MATVRKHLGINVTTKNMAERLYDNMGKLERKHQLPSYLVPLYKELYMALHMINRLEKQAGVEPSAEHGREDAGADDTN